MNAGESTEDARMVASVANKDLSPVEAAPLDPLFGRMLDTDGHIYMPVEVLEALTKDLGTNANLDFYKRFVRSKEYEEGLARNRADLFDVKGMAALGATDVKGRIEALDLMGAKAQLAFPNTFGAEQRIDSDAARAANRRVNDYYLDWCSQTGGRVWPAVNINMTDVDWAIAELDRVLKIGGVGGINMSCATPPGGAAPSHSQWDPFWARIQEANVPALIHLGGGGLISGRDPDPMFPERAWGDAESLRGAPAERGGGEEAISPYFLLVAHMPAELYLQTMVMGRVFERFPNLRFGIFEFGTTWIGQCVQRMDAWADFQVRVVGRKFEMKPSEYVRRNIRVGPFFHEPISEMIDQYGLKEIYCYNTDFPHLEGSKDPIRKFRERIANQPESYAQAFFVDNAKWIMPYAS
jgi:predicted TIM-barrel fold metal-dependent hydrolase